MNSQTLTICIPVLCFIALSGCMSGRDAGAEQSRLIEREVSWLQKHPLTVMPAKEARPRSAEACPKNNIVPINQPMLLPEEMNAAIAQAQVKPWSFVQHDIDEDGMPTALRVIESSGYTSFDEAAKENVAQWRYSFKKGVRQAAGCVVMVLVE